MQITIRSDHSSSREVNDDSIVKSDAENVAGEKKKFMKLQCPHCNVKTVTFSVSSLIASRYIKDKVGPSKNKLGHLRGKKIYLLFFYLTQPSEKQIICFD